MGQHYVQKIRTNTKSSTFDIRFLVIDIGIISVVLGVSACTTNAPSEKLDYTLPQANVDLLRSPNEDEVLKAVKIVVLDGVNTLSFENSEDLQAFSNYCFTMPSEKSIAFIKKRLNVTPYLSQLFDYYRDIEYLDRTVSNRESAIFALDSLSSVYASSLIFDKDKVAYINCLREDEAIVANTDGKYIVGGEIRAIRKVESLDELKCHTIETKWVPSEQPGLRANNPYAITRDRKAIMSLSYNPQEKEIAVTFTAQKKILFGLAWNSYNTTYSGRLQTSDLGAEFYVYGQYKDKVLVRKEELDSDKLTFAPFTIKVGQLTALYIDTQEEAARFTLRLGKFRKENDQYIPGKAIFMKGLVEVWSRGISYEDRGKDQLLIEHSVDLD